MFPCCWITALIALFASLGISIANVKVGLIVGIPTSIFISFVIFKKFTENKSKSCCSKEK